MGLRKTLAAVVKDVEPDQYNDRGLKSFSSSVEMSDWIRIIQKYGTIKNWADEAVRVLIHNGPRDKEDSDSESK